MKDYNFAERVSKLDEASAHTLIKLSQHTEILYKQIVTLQDANYNLILEINKLKQEIILLKNRS
jgi:cell division protein FtsB